MSVRKAARGRVRADLQPLVHRLQLAPRAARGAVLFFTRAAKAFCPVDTGRLRRSIRPGARLTIWASTKYAQFVEFGTKFQRAQPYMRPALVLTRRKMELDANRNKAARRRRQRAGLPARARLTAFPRGATNPTTAADRQAARTRRRG